ncbi:MAG: hypothetical protein RIC16_06775 [Rhodospirillales bacterium]
MSACTQVDLIYSFADDVLASRAKSFLDMSDDRDESHLRATIDDLFSAETSTLAPAYSSFLRGQAGLLERSAGGPTRDEADALVAEFRDLLVASSETAAPYFARVLVRHTTPGRLDHFEAALAEWREERREEDEDMTPAEALAERIERTTEQVERFVPDLTDTQLETIAAFVERDMARREPGRWLLYTERRHAALIAFLRTRPDEAAIAAYMVPWLSRPYELVDPAFEAHAEAWWAGKAELVWLVARDLSAEQRIALIEKLRGYATDIAALI